MQLGYWKSELRTDPVMTWRGLLHGTQEHYNDHVPEKDAKLISIFAEKFVDTTCHGCVWYHDADPNQRLGSCTTIAAAKLWTGWWNVMDV